MQEPQQNSQNDFMIEKIKERPISRRRLIRRTLITAAMAVVFGTIACVTFIVLEPVISNRLNPEEEAPPVQPIVFPEDREEMSPEDMLEDNMPTEEPSPSPEEPAAVMLEEEQIQEILSRVSLDKEHYKEIYSALSAYVDELNHSMVTVTGVSSNVDWFNNVEQSSKQSSGVIVAENGVELLVVADYTPLQNAESMSMTFSYLDAQKNVRPEYQIPVALKALDAATNLAVLSVSLEEVPEEIRQEDGFVIAALGSSNTRNIVGTPVIALGNPMGVSGSMGYGMITARSGQYQKADINCKILQTDIFGSQTAGGVLFNLQNQVVGIITSSKSGTDVKNVVCAYGISELKKRIENMSNGIPLVYLGITGGDVTAEAHVQLGVPYGAYVRDVDRNSPAMPSGIQKGDVIVSFGERTVLSYNDYINALMQAEAGVEADITVMRASQGEYKEMTFRMVPEAR